MMRAVTAGRPEIVGREAEIAAIDAFLGDRAGLPGSLVIEGPAGAGKSTLWREAIDRAGASGYLALTARPSGAEIQLAFAALADILEAQLVEVAGELPAPQRRALEVALLLAGEAGLAPDQRAIAAGTLNAVRALARRRPVLLAIDDAQWLDAPSGDILAFVLRRLRDEPVALVASWRTESLDATARLEGGRRSLVAIPDRTVTRIDVGPLSRGALHRLLRTRTSLEFNRRTLQRIHETSGGNPFYALELARAIDRDPPPGEQLPIGSGLSELLADRLAGMAPATRDALFVAAASSQSDVPLLEAVLGSAAGAALRLAEEAGLIRVDADAIEFVHPLLAAAAYGLPDRAGRQAWHARLAETVRDPEARARHLALARLGISREVAEALLEGARTARARGAPGAAAELYVAALERLPEEAVGDQAAWAVEAAPVLRVTGGAQRSRDILEPLIERLDAGPLRSDALLELAEAIEGDAGAGSRSLELIERAYDDAGDDVRRRAAALLKHEMWERHRDRSPAALPIALRALALAEESGDEQLTAAAHVRAADLEVVLGVGGEPVARFARALELGERHPVQIENSAHSMLAVCLIRAGRLDEAMPHLLLERARAIAEGDETSHSWECLFLAELEWLAGRWDEAAAHAAEGLEVAEQADLRMRAGALQALVALVEASRGDPNRARAQFQRAIEILDEVEETSYANYARQMLAFLELSLGDARAADEVRDTYALDRVEGSKRLSFVGDAIEALVALGDLETATNLASELDRRGKELGRPTLTSVAARCRALILGARGDLEGAIASAESAIAAHAELRLPFEHARSLLVLGEVQRRAKQRRAARETLTAAQAAFDRLGARLWSERAAAERARIGGRTQVEGLTETELRVAELVAAGRSNKEVAAELFVSVRAVEANLSRVYAKLGIESRTELARRL
jgi:DNA-binding CsgD family transcriptional regulator